MQDWEELEEQCKECLECELCKTRTNIVFGRGNTKAKLMLIGEGPGKQEDLQGLPFVGAAGKLLSSLLGALGIEEDDYYITNIVKCRPPGNRVPTEEEANACMPCLRAQTRMIKPKIIVCLGSTAAKYIVDKNAKITEMRGKWIERKGFWIMPTFHPAALLRDKSKKILMWEDFKKVKQRLDELY